MKAYCNMNYLSKERWISFWYQMMEVMEAKPESVLEIGPGPGIVIRAIRDFGVFGVTADVDFRLRPTVGADITGLPFGDKTLDCVLAAEVLEHIPFAEVPKALKELARVSRKAIVITLPHFHQFAPAFSLKIFPFVPRLFKVFPISLPIKHKFDGQHYWEIGKTGYSLSKIRKFLMKVNSFRLVKDYLIEENPYHHVFVLKRSESETAHPNDANGDKRK